jgi:exosortase
MKELTQIKSESWIKAALYGLLLAGIFHTSHRVMVGWWENEDYTYCYLIAPIVLYLIWEKRAELAKVATRPSWAGLAPLAFGIFLFWLGELAGEFTTMYFASWFVLAGLLLLHLGWDKLKVIWFPVVFLAAMFPPPQFFHFNLTLKLKLISSRLGVAMLQWYGMSAYREGNVIDLGFTQLQVVDACSGLRYLYPLIIMAILMAYFFKSAWWKKVVLVVSAVPLTIGTNSLRIAMTGILYEIWGPAVAEDFFHGFSGWLIFIFGLAVLLLEMAVLKRLPGERQAIVAKSKSQPDKFHWLDLFHWSNSLKGEKNKSNWLGLFDWSNWLKRKRSEPSGLYNSVEPIEPIKPIEQSARSGFMALLHPPQFVVAVLLLAATIALAQGIEFREKIPVAKPFGQFPLQVGEWAGKRDVIDQKFLEALTFSDYVIVDYVNGGHGVNFYTAYYETQRKGESIHSPETCLPGSGWEFKNAGTVAIPLGAGAGVQGSGFSGSTGTAGAVSANPGSRILPAPNDPNAQNALNDPNAQNALNDPNVQNAPNLNISVNRAVMEKGAYKQLAYFWFPMRGRVLTNIWQMKWFTFWDALTRQRTDGALVRLITPVYQNESIEEADKRLVSFTREIVPVLNEFLPK